MNLFRQRPGILLPPIALTLLFMWVYGRTASQLYFVMDDFINSHAELHASILDVITGRVTWSGYRPLTLIQRVLLLRAFGLEQMLPYYLVMLGMHLANVLLTYALVLRVAGKAIWAFVVAAIMLLLPSHNEAVFWFAANASPLAFLFGILALHASCSHLQHGGSASILMAAIAYGASVLSFEVMIVLPGVILLADLLITRDWRATHKRWRFYLVLALVALAVLSLRFITPEGTIMPQREDYRFSLSPAVLLQGYTSLFMQMVLLGTSPQPGVTDYVNLRDWMPAANPEAIVAIVLALLCAGAVMIVFGRSHATTSEAGRAQRQTTQLDRLGWLLWGVLWIVSIGLPFAGLAGRNPENRYTYILGFGFAIAVAALLALIWNALGQSCVLRSAVTVGVAVLIAFYAYVSTSDASEWTRASAHVRAHLAELEEIFPNGLKEGASVITLGLPFQVGAAYVYGIGEAYKAALDLTFGDRPARGIMGTQELLERFAEPDRTIYYGLRYTSPDEAMQPYSRMLICVDLEECTDVNIYLTEEQLKERWLSYGALTFSDHPEWGVTEWFGATDTRETWKCYETLDQPLADDAEQPPSKEERCDFFLGKVYDGK